MNKLISKIVGACLGLSLATGVGVGVAVGQNSVQEANAATTTYTSVASLSAGDTVVFAYESGNTLKELTGVTTIGTATDYSIAEKPNGTFLLKVEAGSVANSYAFKNGSNYLSWSSGNSLTTSTTKNDASSWKLPNSPEAGSIKLTNVGTTSRIMQYNSGSPRWACYTSSQSAFIIYKVVVSGDAIPVSSISLSSSSTTVKVGKTATLTATISPNDATNKIVAWTTSNSNVATVANGVVTGVAAGNATITAIADENNNGTLDSGEKSATCSVTVQAIQTIDATVAEALIAANSLGNGEVSADLYCVTGYVTEVASAWNSQYGNVEFKIADTAGGTPTIICYRISCAQAIGEKVLVGAKLTVTGNLKNHNGNTPEIVNNSNVSNPIVILEEGSTTFEEPDLVETTYAGFLAATDADYTRVYHFTAEVKAVTNTTYGNMTLTDGTTDLTVYGSTATVSALVWGDTTGKYSYSTQTDFSSNNLTKDIAAGDTIEVNFVRYMHNNALQAQGIILNVTHAPTITLNKNSLSLTVGSDETLIATITNGGNPTPTISWSSSDASIASVSGGTVTAEAVGSATITASITINAKNYSAKCNVTVTAAPVVIDAEGTYTVVSDASTLVAGDTVIITNASGEKALSTTQNNNNRGSTDTSISDGVITISGTTSIQAFVLESYVVGDYSTFAFNTGGGYIYAAGANSSNYLRTQETLNDNGKFTIDIAENVATITARGSASRNLLQYNSTNDIFACYGSAQGAVSIFKKGNTPADPTKVASVVLSSSSASIEVGSSTTLTATINPSTAAIQTATWLSDDEDVATVLNGVVTGVAAGTATITAFADENSNDTLDSGEKSAICVVTVTSAPTPSGNGEWVLESIANLTSSDIFVIVGNDGDDYAMSNNNGASNPPSAVQVTVADGKITSQVPDSIKWNISSSASEYTFYPNGDSEKWLYCTNTNNGVRVGTGDNKTFDIEDESGYLVNAGTSRYIGVYNSQDWRCCTSINNNISGQSFEFYKYVEATEDLASKYADLFLEKLSTGDNAVCQVTQSGEVQTVLANLVSAWSTLKTQFNALSSDDQGLFTNGQANENGTNIQKAIALYDYIATKYNTQLGSDYNFMGRSISNARQMVNILNVSENPAIPAIAVVIALATVTTGAYFFLRKKKEN